MPVKPIPEGYHSVTPYLIVNGAAKAIEFYKRAFGAEARGRMEMPGGRLGHAEIQIGNSRIMLADEFPEMDARGPQAHARSMRIALGLG
jgi:PhnB protein